MSLHPETDADRRSAEVVRSARSRTGTTSSATGLVVACFAEVGIALEDDLLALHLAGEPILGSDLFPADLLFRTGQHDAYHQGDRQRGVGHVGIYSGEGTVLHASPSEALVQEDTIDAFFDAENGHYRGTRRLIAR